MSVILPGSTPGSVTSEYAAVSSTITRAIQNINGEMVAVFNGNVSYQRTEYLVQDGRRVGIVNTDLQPGQIGNANQNRFGNVYLDPAKLAAAFQSDPDLAAAFEKVASFEDGLIHADLVARNIITE